MNVPAYLAAFAILLAIPLLWARWAKLDLGFRRPDYRAAEPWALLFILWITAEWAIQLIFPYEIDPNLAAEMAQYSLTEDLFAFVIVAPLCEELLFRGAMFSALYRRWGIRAAVIVPSILWGLLHSGYGWLFAASIGGAGVLLAMVRWKGGSIYPPIALHAAINLLGMLYNRGLLGNAV